MTDKYSIMINGDLDSRANGSPVNNDDESGNSIGWRVEVEGKNAKTANIKEYGIINDMVRRTVHWMRRFIWLRKELLVQLKLCFPIVLTWLFQNLMLFVSLIFVGHISGQAFELDSVALATSFINVTGLSVGIGLSSAADTLCAQTFGFKNYKRVGHILQQGILILLVQCFFVWGVWLNTENLLNLLQQPPCISRYAAYYTEIFAICLPAFFVYVMLQKYLQAQSHVWPFILVGFLANIINVILHSVLLLVLDLGIIGAAISMVISNIFQPIFLVVYIKILKLHKKTWGGWSWQGLNDWWQFLKLGIPGMVMICVEWTSFEVVVFVLGSISEVELAINSIMVNLLILMFMIPLGISITGGIRVGNALGAGEPLEAKRISYTSILLVVINAILQLSLLQCIKNVIGSLYTEEEAVLQRLPILVNVVTPGLFFDQIQLVIQGILRGCGLQTIGAVINFFAFYFLGLPIGITLAFTTDMGVIGVWIGLMFATTFQCVIYLIIVLRMNWKKQAEKAQIRASNNKVQVFEKKTEDSSTTSSIHETEDILLEDLSTLKEGTDEGDCEVIECTTAEGDNVMVDDGQHSEEAESPLLTDEEHDHCQDGGHRVEGQSYNKTKLLLTKGSLFLLGIAFIVVTGVGSHFKVPEYLHNGNYTECTEDMDNVTTIYGNGTTLLHFNTTTVYHSRL